MGSKNKSKTTSILIVALVIAVISMAVVSFNLSGNKTTDQDVIDTTTQQVITASGNAEFCANNPDLSLKARIVDSLATSKTYVNGTLYLQNLDTGSITSQSITSGGSSTFTTLSDVLDCNSEKGYKVYVMAQIDANSNTDSNSDGEITITPDMLKKDPVEMTIVSSLYTSFKVRGYDNIGRAKITQESDNSTSDVRTLTSIFTQSAGTNWTATATDNIDVTFTLGANTTARAKGIGTIIAIDTEDSSNLDDFDESLAEVYWNGVKLSEATGLDDNTLRALTSYELLYVVEDSVGMSADGSKVAEAELRVKLQSESTATSKEFDPVIKIIGLGDYESDKDDKVLKGVGFRDDSSRTELYDAQTITLLVQG